jgi:uncharacterized membrane protein HdeD (DUF308 family)
MSINKVLAGGFLFASGCLLIIGVVSFERNDWGWLVASFLLLCVSLVAGINELNGLKDVKINEQ